MGKMAPVGTVWSNHTKMLELELAEATAQRDALAEALRLAAERFRNPKYGCEWPEAAQEIENKLRKVKGETP
jgi:hypothetical protein